MANGKIRFGKQSGGQLALVIPDGATNTEVVVPESGTLVSVGTTVTDNAIVRFDGNTGQVKNSGVTIDNGGNVGSGTQAFNGFGGSGFKNYLINGNFAVWQRGTDVSNLTNATYLADRWVVFDAVGDINYNVIRAAGVFTGGYGALYTFNSGTGVRSVMQFVENVTRFKVGSKITISFEAYTDSAPYTVNVAIQATKGRWINSTVEVGSNITLTNTKTRYSVTLTVPDWTTLGVDFAHLEDTALACKFNLPSTTNGKNFLIGNVQLEDGSIATPFEKRPYGLELALCQRYYQAHLSSVTIQTERAFHTRFTSNIGQTVVFDNIQFPPMRTLPTISLSCLNDSTTRVSGVSNNGVIENDWRVYNRTPMSFTIYKLTTPVINAILAFDAILDAEL